VVIPRSVLRPSIAGSPLRNDLELLSDILQVARTFFGALADDAAIGHLINGYPIGRSNGDPVTLTAALGRQSLELTTRRARIMVPAGVAAIFDDGMWSVVFVDAIAATRGGGPGLVLYFVATPTAWMIIPGALYGPPVVRQISFLAGWPDPLPTASA
jgi:hypothetical protein